MKLILILLPLVYLAGNGYLFWRVMHAISFAPLWCRIMAGILIWAAAFSLFAAVGLRDAGLPEAVLRWMFRIGSVWMVFLLYMVLLLVVSDIAGIFIPKLKPSLLFALPVTLCILGYGYINYRHPKVEHVDISLEKEGAPVRIVAVSDVHLGYGTGVSALKKYVEKINSQGPDLILIAGDLIDNSVKPLLNEPFAEVLSRLKAPMGIYMVPGNHEYISGIDACLDFLKDTPITVLRDSMVILPGGQQLIGRDDISNRGRKSLEDLMDAADRSRAVIVLDHQPYDLKKTDSLGADLQISGHTHRGQIWPINWITDRLFEQSHGYRKWPHTHVWVSSGLSLWGPPFRIGTHSDMAVIELK